MSSVNPNLPPDFPKSAGFWADYFGVDPGTVRGWTDKHGIPYYYLGRERYITPADLIACLPKVRPTRRHEE